MTEADEASRGGAQVTETDEATSPVLALFDAVVGQPDVVSYLRAASRRPVHAYLFVGPPGAGLVPAARAFAAAVLCPAGGCGTCSTCRRAIAGVHPDVVEIERRGAALSVDDAHRVVALAQRRPLEGARQVVVVSDLHVARLAAPVLLKTLEEPPGATVFVLVADAVPPDLATVASRCVRVDFPPVGEGAIAAWLRAQGIDDTRAAEAAEAADGDVERARVLADDPGVRARRDLWRSVPARLDGTGASAAALARELLDALDGAGEPLRRRHGAELEALAEAAQAAGERPASGRSGLEERHRREERRFRTDELRSGLAVLARAYRDRLVAEAPGSAHGAQRAMALRQGLAAVDGASAELVRNPNEALLLEGLFVRLSAVVG